MKWVRQRCQLAPVNTAAMAFFSPWWASEVTSSTPLSPRAVSDLRKASQKAPSSLAPTSIPRISRCPSALTPVATTTQTLTMRPPSRTFWVRPSSHT